MAYQENPARAEDTAHVDGHKGIPVLAVRRDADTTSVSTDGDYENLHMNPFGRLKVSTQAAAIDATTGNITTSTGTVVADVNRASNVIVQLTGTYTGLNATFEISIDGGTTYFATQLVRTNANTIESTTGVTNGITTYGWEGSVNACTHFRVRATALTSGTVAVRILPGVFATEPIPASQVTATQPVSGTVTVASTSLNASATVTGTTLFRDIALTNTDVTVKASAGRVHNWYFKNPHATDTAWVHFYNALIANVTVGTTVPVWSVEVPAGGTNEFTSTIPMAFATGITLAVTTSATHTVTTAPTTPLIGFVGYI